MIFRAAKPDEIPGLLADAYPEWQKGRTFAQYCADNRKEEAYGTRFVLEKDGEVVSSLIWLWPENRLARKVFGIGSVVTPPRFRGKGYASEMLTECLRMADLATDLVILYSDIHPAFYERFAFRALPDTMQRKSGSVCMALCDEAGWRELLASPMDTLPEYF